MKSSNNKIKFAIGIAISLVFIFLAFRKVNFADMWQAFKSANYWYFLPAIVITFLSHFLRSLRWRYLLDPIKRVDIPSLFSALIIGYMANVFMPAHLGEFIRAYILGKKRDIALSSTFATIVIERIIDIFSLLTLMVVTIFVYPFPAWVTKSGYIMFAATFALFLFLVLLKVKTRQTLQVIHFFVKPLSAKFAQKIEGLLIKFVAGVVALKKWQDYLVVTALSIIIWSCYAGVFYFSFFAFDFNTTYHLPWTASLVLLVITTVSVVVPSSPGYVGTYHYLCQLSLAMFHVPAGPALSFATVVHGISFLPVLIAGLFLARYEGMAISKMTQKPNLEGTAIEAV